jgi:hypothetical protein
MSACIYARSSHRMHRLRIAAGLCSTSVAESRILFPDALARVVKLSDSWPQPCRREVQAVTDAAFCFVKNCLHPTCLDSVNNFHPQSNAKLQS